MKTNLVRGALGAWLLGTAAVVAVAMTPAPVLAAAKAPSGPHTSPAVGKALQAALAAVQGKDFASAQAALAAAKAVPGPTDVDLAEIDEVSVYLALSMNDHPTALALYKRIIASPLFPAVETPDQQKQSLKNAMMLANEAKDYAMASQIGERIANSGSMDDKAAGSLAEAYYYNKEYAKAQSLAQKSIDAAIAQGVPPDRGAIQIVMNIYSDQKDQANARKMLEMLARYHPDSEVWAKMVDITIGTTPGMKDMQLLQLYRLRVLSGADGDASDYNVGADLAMKNGYPGEARTILQTAAARGVAGVSGKLAEARAKAAADEKTLAGNDASAAKAASGQLDTLVAEQFFGYGRFAEAETAAKRAISKGGSKDPEEPKMILGMALASDGKYADAIQAFSQVGGNEAQKKIAHVWTVYAQSKSQPATTAAATPAPAKP
jgi:tetratricopeptide (TPR) repeat protein